MPEQKKAVTPRLRFPEFRDAGPWEVKRLGRIFMERTERGGEGLQLLSVTISDGVVRTSELERTNNASTDLSNYKRVYPGDIVYNSMRMWQGASGVSLWHGLVSPAYTVVTPVEGQNPVFWSYHFKLSHSIDKFARFSQGLTSDTWNLKYPAFSAIKMAFPSIPEEQQKIADCLSSLDELIELQAKKLEALKAHKKGLMQQLFPREGETTPRLRFPEFRDAGPWEVKRLGDIGPVCMCKRVLKHQTSDKGDIPFYKIGTFGSKPDAYISKELYESYKSIYPFPNKGDVLISASGTIGRTVVYDGCPAYFQDSNIVWIANKEAIVLNAFLAYCYETVRWPTDDNTIPRLYNDNLRKMKIVVPSKQEQQKIADCLSLLDELIELEAKKLEALKAHKKGLMQQLFPQEVG